MEIITGTRPTDEKLNNGTNLHEYVNSAFLNNIHTILDPMLLQDETKETDIMQNCIIPFVRVGLSCSMASPKARWEMGRVCAQLFVIKDALSSIHSI